MKNLKRENFADRRKTSDDAKKALLEKLRGAQKPAQPDAKSGRA